MVIFTFSSLLHAKEILLCQKWIYNFMKTPRSKKSDTVEDQEHNLIRYFNQDDNFLLQ